MPTTLICAAAGTGISGVMNRLKDGSSDLELFDVEAHLKQNLISNKNTDSRFSRLSEISSPNMGDICRELERSLVLELWSQALHDVSKKVGKVKTRDVVVVLHLTFFNAKTLEFFNSNFIRIGKDIELDVDQIVLLIDDVYDMKSRLEGGEQNLLDNDIAAAGYLTHIAKITGLDEEGKAPLSNLVKYDSEIESLQALISWRRAEMIAAEALSRNLRVPLITLGLKHPERSLQEVVQATNPLKTIYISHKITDARRVNHDHLIDSAEHPIPWPDKFVLAVNELPGHFYRDNLVCIQPTAIDELRFLRGAGSLEDFSGYPTERWPIPSQTLFPEAVPSDPPKYTSSGNQVIDSMQSATARNFAKRLFDEIAFRDHFLVSTTNHLLVYRPLSLDGRMSGGVEREISHWADFWYLRDDERDEPGQPSDKTVMPRRAIFLHLIDDIFRFLNSEEFFGQKKRMATRSAVQREFCKKTGQTESDFENRFEQKEVASSHLSRSTSGGNQQYELSMERACKKVLNGLFIRWLCGSSHEPAREGLGLFLGDTNKDLVSASAMEQIVSFIHGKTTSQTLNEMALDRIVEAANATSFSDLAFKICQGSNFEVETQSPDW